MLKLEHTCADTRTKVQLLRSISRLKVRSEFHDLLETLRLSLQAIDQKNRSAEHPNLAWGQGAAQFVAGLLETIDKCDETLRALESHAKKNL